MICSESVDPVVVLPNVTLMLAILNTRPLLVMG